MATEKRLIDANELVRKTNKLDVFYFTGETDIQIHDCQMVELGAVLAEIDEAPTVDAVEVVRCKDCKHTRKKNGHEQFMYNESVCICTKEDIWGITKNELVWDDGFRSHGERKDNG